MSIAKSRMQAIPCNGITENADFNARSQENWMSGQPQVVLSEKFMYERELPGIVLLFGVGPSPANSGRHSHEKAVLNFVIRGRVTQIDDLRHEVDCGPLSVSVTPPGMRHEHVFRSPKLKSLCAAIDPQILRSAGCTKILESPIVLAGGPPIATLL